MSYRLTDTQRDALITANDVAALAEKVTPVGADLVIIEDSADSFNKKKVQVSSLSGSDGRLIVPRIFSVTLAQLQAEATAHRAYACLTLSPTQYVRWCYMWHSGSTNYAGTGITGMFVSLGRSADPDSLYLQMDMLTGGTFKDNNDDHGLDFGIFKAMGEIGAPNDATTYFNTSNALIIDVTATGGGNLSALTAGGTLYGIFEIGNLDVSAAEVTT